MTEIKGIGGLEAQAGGSILTNGDHTTGALELAGGAYGGISINGRSTVETRHAFTLGATLGGFVGPLSENLPGSFKGIFSYSFTTPNMKELALTFSSEVGTTLQGHPDLVAGGTIALTGLTENSPWWGVYVQYDHYSGSSKNQDFEKGFSTVTAGLTAYLPVSDLVGK